MVNYAQKELSIAKDFMKDFKAGTCEGINYPPDKRFFKLSKPVALSGGGNISFNDPSFNFFLTALANTPFCGSTIITIPPIKKDYFEKFFCKVEEIPELINFIKRTGKLQIVFREEATAYEGLDYLDPIFKELNPPEFFCIPIDCDGKTEKCLIETFRTLCSFGYRNFVRDYSPTQIIAESRLQRNAAVYVTLRLLYPAVAEEVENTMVDNPEEATYLFHACQCFLHDPVTETRSDMTINTADGLRLSELLPTQHRPKMHFPCEIGRFLFEKLTYAPLGLHACEELMDHYYSYDLKDVEQSLNEAITNNKFDIVSSGVKQIEEILDNVWNDKTIMNRINVLKIGIPVASAIIGTCSVAAGITIGITGFLAGLGYELSDRVLALGTENISERIAKLATKSYQANIYDFKQKYSGIIISKSIRKH